jgi:hypothetical protein
VKQKMIETLNETISFYKEDPTRRSTNGLGYCVYKNQDGNCCAVGRKMTEADHKANFGSLDLSKIWGNIESPIIRELPFLFWSDLQILHDRSIHWDMDGLTIHGMIHIDDMRKRIESGVYTS